MAIKYKTTLYLPLICLDNFTKLNRFVVVVNGGFCNFYASVVYGSRVVSCTRNHWRLLAGRPIMFRMWNVVLVCRLLSLLHNLPIFADILHKSYATFYQTWLCIPLCICLLQLPVFRQSDYYGLRPLHDYENPLQLISRSQAISLCLFIRSTVTACTTKLVHITFLMKEKCMFYANWVSHRYLYYTSTLFQYKINKLGNNMNNLVTR